jgi:iron-sulfur cluster assembly protein
MTLTDAAAARVREIMAKADPSVAGIRVGVTKGGCAGMSYKVDYTSEIKPGDEVIDDKGVRVIIDPTAVLFLLGTEMDYKVDKLAAQFVFNNPNQTSACGCGESVAITPAGEQAQADAR